MSNLPSGHDVAELDSALSLVVPADYEDGNGHVNVRHHYDLHMRACDAAFAKLGFDEDYRDREGMSVFSVEHHITFHSEVLVGHRVSVHLRLIGRSDKIIHAMSILVNNSTNRVANTIEFIEAHVDLNTRRAAPLGERAASALDQVIATHQGLRWELPRSGVMGPR